MTHTTFVLMHVAAVWGWAAIVIGWSSGARLTGKWRWVALTFVAVVLILNLSASLVQIAAHYGTDWRVLAEHGRHAGTPLLYASTDFGPYRYSPLYAWLLVPLGWLGQWGFTALHLAVVPLFRNWRIIALLLVSWPFWVDAIGGNVLTFVILAAWWALRGNRLATGGYLAMMLLMPRPIMIPLAGWILWQRPEWRLPFGVMVVTFAGLVAWTGLAGEWLPALLGAGDMLDHPQNFGPSQWFGPAWLPIAAVAGAWFTYRGRLGVASLALSPYLIPYYWLFALLELRPRAEKEGSADVASGVET